jgi:hypothetical protein
MMHLKIKRLWEVLRRYSRSATPLTTWYLETFFGQAKYDASVLRDFLLIGLSRNS